MSKADRDYEEALTLYRGAITQHKTKEDAALTRLRLPPGDGDIDGACRAILRQCRLGETDIALDCEDVPVVELETETELRAAETLEDRKFGHVELLGNTWHFLPGQRTGDKR
jgi:hypothetical protein